MSTRNKQIKIIIFALTLLFAVSAYRVWSVNNFEHDPFMRYILEAVYSFLIFLWSASIYSRVTQKSMQIWLYLEAALMFIGLTIRFLQETYWYRDIPLMRVSGLCLAATILPMLLFGMYASLGIGQNDQYSMNRKWLGFLVPVIAATYLILTDEKRHFVFFLESEEQQPNLSFHPGVGTFLFCGIGVVLMILRVLIIYRRNRDIRGKGIMRVVIPCFEPIVMASFTLYYFLFSLGIVPWLEGKEIIELYAKIYMVEVLTWEFYIFMGLVPVNMEYQSILENSTVGMQILSESEKILSKSAVPVSQETVRTLEEKEFITLEDGKELHMHALSDGYFLWYTDTSLLRRTIEDLENSVEQLSQKGYLLEEELRAKNNTARILAQNRIYDDLNKEVSGQLQIMKELIDSQKNDENAEEKLRRLYLLGTYVKRRCNLRLIHLETGMIAPEDIQISLEDMVKALEIMNIPASVHWDPSEELPPDYLLCVLDTLEGILKYEDFELSAIRIETVPEGVKFEVYRSGDSRKTDAFQGIGGRYVCVLEDIRKNAFDTSGSQKYLEGYQITLLTGGGHYDAEA